MAQNQQLLLDFPGSDTFTEATTLPLPEQAKVWQFLKQESLPKAILLAPEGMGKSHILHIWAAEKPIQSAENLASYESNSALIVENISTLQETEQEALFHAFNKAHTGNQAILLASQKPVAQMDLLPDLKSRLMTLPEIKIDAFSEASLTQLLLKWAADCQLKLDGAVVRYILTRADRSPVALRQMIAQLNTLSLTEKRAVTVPLARRILTENGA